MPLFDRRQLLASTASIVFSSASAVATVIHGGTPWHAGAGAPPKPFTPGAWHFFTDVEARTVEAIADRIIPPDDESPGGKDAGVADFIDRQLAGPFGRGDGHYKSGPFKKGTKEQGHQSPLTPGEQYRRALAALDAHAAEKFGGRRFAELDGVAMDDIIHTLEAGDMKIDGVEAKDFFTMVLKNVREGYFADPIYGGNRNMASWRWLGFPGARYDFSDWIERHNERYPLGPIGIAGAPAWTVR